ncbi:MAG: ankyrin repeat domain-containing protein [Candidatus Hydrogenedentes bacterium]|nr:ankyrin repeat domain-containing protein [Candidatus Hydrogenedentota bacterium]
MPWIARRASALSLPLLLAALVSCSDNNVEKRGTAPPLDRSRMSPQERIFDAAKRGDVKELDRLVASDPALVKARDNQGQTPLHYTALSGNPAAAQLLLKKGADPLAKDHEEHTAAYYASEVRAAPEVSKVLWSAANAAAVKQAPPK